MTRRLALSFWMTLIFVLVEISVSILASSLALMTDAAHNFTDLLTLGLSWHAQRLALKPAHARRTYGYHRAGILVALINSSMLALIAGGIFFEAYRRFLSPIQVQAGFLIWVGLAGMAVNLVTALLLQGGVRQDLNLRSAYLHLIGDLLSSFGAVIAGVVIHFTRAYWVDPFASIVIGLLILATAWRVVREAVGILMEATPADIDMDSLLSAVRSVPGVLGVHDLHTWSINRSTRALSAHILTKDMSLGQGARIQTAVSHLLAERFRIGHVTLQLECEDCVPADLYCDINRTSKAAESEAWKVSNENEDG
jgi:cobalt-zinc-cadmium efflux system protein